MWQDGSVESIESNNDVAKIEKMIFYFLCGYALCSSVSMGGANICLGLATVASAIRLVKKHDDWQKLLNVDKGLAFPFGVYIAVLLITDIFSVDILNSVNNILEYYVKNLMPFLLVMMFVRDKKKIITIAVLSFISFLINDIFCIYQWYIHRDATRGAGSNIGRSVGFLRHMSTAGIMAMWIPIQILLSIYLRDKFKKILLVSIIISILALLGNNTRGMWLAVIITTLLTSFIYVKAKIKFICVVLVLLFGMGCVVEQVPWIHDRIASINLKDGSNQERLSYLWPSAYNMGGDYPLTGVGSGNFEKMYHDKYALPGSDKNLSHAHSIYFQRFAEQGYPGLLAFFVWVIGTFVYCVKGWKRERNIGYLLFMSIFMGLFLHGVTEHVFSHPITMKLFWFGLGLSYQWTKLKDDEIQSGAV